MVDLYRNGRWEGKGILVLYLDFLVDIIQLLVYLAFFFTLMKHYGLPLHLIRQMWFTFKSFSKRVALVLRYQKATRDMDRRFPEASPHLLQDADVCIVCREEMETGRVLPCGHIMHRRCLLSWLERSQTCPICRDSVLVEENNQPNYDPNMPFQFPPNQFPNPQVPPPYAGAPQIPVYNNAQNPVYNAQNPVYNPQNQVYNPPQNPVYNAPQNPVYNPQNPPAHQPPNFPNYPTWAPVNNTPNNNTSPNVNAILDQIELLQEQLQMIQEQLNHVTSSLVQFDINQREGGQNRNEAHTQQSVPISPSITTQTHPSVPVSPSITTQTQPPISISPSKQVVSPSVNVESIESPTEDTNPTEIKTPNQKEKNDAEEIRRKRLLRLSQQNIN